MTNRETRKLCAVALADRTGVERQHILIFLTQATKLKYGFVGAVNVLTDPLTPVTSVSELPTFVTSRAAWGEMALVSARFQQKQFVRHVADLVGTSK